MMKKRTPFLGLVLGGVLVAGLAGLAGCSSGEKTTSTPTPTVSKAPAAVTEKCVEGFMLIDADSLDAKKTLAADDCSTVAVVGSNGAIKIGSVDTIIVEGNHNKVDIDSVKTVRLAGDENMLTYSSTDAPAIDDKGSGNTVKVG